MKNSSRMLLAVLALSGGTLVFNGCAGTPTRKSTGEMVDDATITSRIKLAFAKDPGVRALSVNVDTFKGTVQLNGFVDTPAEKARAEQIARDIPGVNVVQNNLSVKTVP